MQAGRSRSQPPKSGLVCAEQTIRPIEISVVSVAASDSEYPNWFQAWCNNCKRYYSPHVGPHVCTTPGQQSLADSHKRLESWLTPPYTFED